MLEGTTQQVLALEAQRDLFEQPLEVAPYPGRGRDMIEQEQPPTWSKYALHLRDCLPIVRDAAERQGADDRVERRVRKRKCLDIPLEQQDLLRELRSSAPSDGDHLLSELDTGQPNTIRVEREVPAGADSDLEYLT